MSIATLLRWFEKLGFVCKRRNRKSQVYQRLDIIASRQRYLQHVRELRSAGYKFFYQAKDSEDYHKEMNSFERW